MPDVTMNNANPDFFRTTLKEPSGSVHPRRTVIVSTLSELVIGQALVDNRLYHDVSANANVTIRALTVTLVGTISIPSGDVRIECKTLVVPPGPSDPDSGAERPGAVLDVSGQRPPLHSVFTPDGAETAKDGTARSGASGEAIMKELREADEPLPYGTDGDPGGKLAIYCDEMVLGGDLVLAANGGDGYPGCDGQDGSPRNAGGAGTGGKGGRGGAGGAGGRVELGYRTVSRADRLVRSADPGSPGLSGRAGLTGADPRLPPGEPADPVPPADAGDVFETTNDLPALGEHLDDELLARMVQRVKQTYLFNQPTHYAGDATSLAPQWARLGAELDWLDAVLSDGEGSRRSELYDTVWNLKSLYARKKTSFGWSANWVPSLSRDVLVAAFDASFAGRVAVESAYRSLRKEYQDAQDADNALADAREALEVARATHQAKLDLFCDQLKAAKTHIRDAVTACETARTDLDTQLAALKDKVASYFNFDLGDLLRAAEMVVFTMGGEAAQGLAMAGVEISSLVNDGVSKISDNDGNPVTKNKLKSDIEAVGRQIVDATHGAMFELDKDGNPQIEPEHREAITKLTLFEDKVRNLSESLGDDIITVVTDALDRLQATIIEKGKAVVLYRLLTRRIVDEYRLWNDANTHLAELGTGKGTPHLDPSSVATVAYYARLYQNILEATMEDYAILRRKYAFVMPGAVSGDDSGIFAKATDCNWPDGRAPDLQALKRKRDDMDGALNTWSGNQPGGATPFPRRNSRSIEKVVIGEGPLLESFRRTGHVTFTTILGSEAADDARGLVRLANSDEFYDIRVTHVLPRVHGGVTDKGMMLVKARSSTWSRIYDSDLNPYTFAYNFPRTAAIEHLVGLPDKPLPETNDDRDLVGDDDGQLADKYLDGIGVFTEWTVWVPRAKHDDEVNWGCDLTNVSAVTIHFKGSHRSIDNSSVEGD